jgi:hypothetical protein
MFSKLKGSSENPCEERVNLDKAKCSGAASSGGGIVGNWEVLASEC